MLFIIVVIVSLLIFGSLGGVSLLRDEVDEIPKDKRNLYYFLYVLASLLFYIIILLGILVIKMWV